MNAALEPTTADVGAAGEVAPPAVERAGRLASELVATVGRWLVIWLAVAVPSSADGPPSTNGLLGITLASAIWLVALRCSFSGVPCAQGVSVGAAIGSVTGLVCVAAVNPLLAGVPPSGMVLVLITAGVFLSAALWEDVVRRCTGSLRVLVVGTSGYADILAEAERCARTRFEIVPARAEADVKPRSSLPFVGVDDIAEVVRSQRPDLVVLGDEDACPAAMDRLLDITDGRFRVASVPTFFEYAFGRVPLSQITPMWFMSLVHLRQHPFSRCSKRAFDVITASLGLIVAVPVLAALALVIGRTPGPVFFRQVRLGEGGRSFTIHKLRTMVDGAERSGDAVWAQEADPRATRIGALLRRTHIDELPQLWNVLKGDMSIVGPRPERPEFIAMLETNVPFWNRRLLGKPGLTGWAQLRCGYTSDCASAEAKLSYDFWYLRHHTLAVDLAICVETVFRMLAMLILRPTSELGRRAAS